jgi:hypothetical protein
VKQVGCCWQQQQQQQRQRALVPVLSCKHASYNCACRKPWHAFPRVLGSGLTVCPAGL